MLPVAVGTMVLAISCNMKLLLLCLGLILVHAHEEENDVVKGNFDISKVELAWCSNFRPWGWLGGF